MFSALGMAGVTAFLVSLPLWFPWVARPILRSAGVRYARYQRDGYARFTLHEASYREAGVTIYAERIQATVPSVWLWRLGFSRQKSQPFARADNWSVEFSAAPGFGLCQRGLWTAVTLAASCGKGYSQQRGKHIIGGRTIAWVEAAAA